MESKNLLYDVFSSNIDQLISINKYLRAFHKEVKVNLSPISWAKEFCTIKISMGRQTGKTTYIGKHIQEFDLVIVRDYSAENDFARRFSHSRSNITTIHDIDVQKGKKYENIYIDDLVRCTKDQIEKIYYLLTRSNINQTFIFLGDN